MQQIIETIGLPGSGKSTWAKKIVEENPGKYKRVNKDDLRSMLDCSKFSKSNEKFVLNVRDFIIKQSLINGLSVIVDDTNFDIKHNERFKEIAKEISKETGRKIEVITNSTFLNVPLEVCIKQDLKRFNSVGEKVIRDMYDKYLKKNTLPLLQNEKLPKIYLCDLDGTIAKMNGRSPFDWHRVFEDEPKKHVIDTIVSLSKDYEIVFVSGRDEVCRDQTEKWIKEHTKIEIFKLYMRPQNDMRKDSIIKKELFDQYIRDKYYVIGVFDDRKQVVETWRDDIGLTVFQCEWGNF